MRAPERIETERLVLQRPRAEDAEAIFERYAGDREVTRFVGWPRHASPQDTRTFLALSDEAWELWPAGPYLLRERTGSPGGGTLLGATGLAFETPYRASTGYVLARDAWGRGYAREALREMVATARALGVRRLYALCHPEHRPSWRVLEREGFLREGVLRRHAEFPNLAPGEPGDVFCYSVIL